MNEKTLGFEVNLVIQVDGMVYPVMALGPDPENPPENYNPEETRLGLWTAHSFSAMDKEDGKALIAKEEDFLLVKEAGAESFKLRTLSGEFTENFQMATISDNEDIQYLKDAIAVYFEQRREEDGVQSILHCSPWMVSMALLAGANIHLFHSDSPFSDVVLTNPEDEDFSSSLFLAQYLEDDSDEIPLQWGIEDVTTGIFWTFLIVKQQAALNLDTL